MNSLPVTTPGQEFAKNLSARARYLHAVAGNLICKIAVSADVKPQVKYIRAGGELSYSSDFKK